MNSCFMSICLSVCWSGIHGPIVYSLLGGGIPIPEQRLCGTIYSVPLFSLLFSRQTMVLIPTPSPPSKIHPVSLPSAVCLYPLYFLPDASSPSVSVHVGRPPPAASGHSASVQRKSTTLRLTADQYPLLVSFLASRMKFCPPPELCVWWYLARVWLKGRRRRSPPRWC